MVSNFLLHLEQTVPSAPLTVVSVLTSLTAQLSEYSLPRQVRQTPSDRAILKAKQRRLMASTRRLHTSRPPFQLCMGWGNLVARCSGRLSLLVQASR